MINDNSLYETNNPCSHQTRSMLLPLDGLHKRKPIPITRKNFFLISPDKHNINLEVPVFYYPNKKDLCLVNYEENDSYGKLGDIVGSCSSEGFLYQENSEKLQLAKIM